jgi:hypothetical protein
MRAEIAAAGDVNGDNFITLDELLAIDPLALARSLTKRDTRQDPGPFVAEDAAILPAVQGLMQWAGAFLQPGAGNETFKPRLPVEDVLDKIRSENAVTKLLHLAECPSDPAR